MAEQQINSQNVGKDGNPTNPVDLIFPLQSEITLEISQIPSYAAKLGNLFDFYDKQLTLKNQQIQNYNLKNETAGLITFLINLQLAIEATKLANPSSVIMTDPEKSAILDYEFITLKTVTEWSQSFQPDALAQTSWVPLPTETRNFSDGSAREVSIYNKIYSIYLTNRTFARTMVVLAPIDTTAFAINPSTLSLLFNIKQIIDKQINSPVPSQFLLCAGKETALSRLEDGFSFLGFDVPVLTSKVVVEDFLNAYIHPIQKIVTAPKPKLTGCTPETKKRIEVLKGRITLYNLQKRISGDLISSTDMSNYVENKAELIELTKLCPENTNQIILFENIKDLDKLGKIFTDFLQKYNFACIVDEAIKCVMPQLPCEEILRDLSVDNFESRLKAAFPYQQQIIGAIVENVNKGLQEENDRRIQQGQEPLDPAGQSQKILDTINSFIDLEALCKIDIPAIIETIKSLFNIDLSVLFNLFDWQFNLKIDFQLTILEALLKLIMDLIQKILNELLGCGAFDSLIAGLLTGNIDASSGLYGDLAALVGGDTSFGNFQQIFQDNLNNFLSQSSDELANLIKFEASTANSIIRTSLTGTLGIGTTPESLLVSDTTTKVDAFGGLLSETVRGTGSVGLAGFKGGADTLFEFDTTKLASTAGQKEFLQEIGKFQISSSGGNTTVNRISDDSIVNISNTLNPQQIQVSRPSSIQQASTADGGLNPFTIYNLRDKNRHILNALVVLNEREGRSSIYVSQANLAEQIKDFVKTCFAVLSPSETIDLITGNASQEVKLTITGISQIRYPLLYALFRYPDRHASLFASFGAISGLNTVATRLQILAMAPAVKQKIVDPNVCAPFNNIYDFRKALMQQTLPEDLANKLMDDLIEDDRKRANALLDALSKKPNITDIATNPNALAVNKTPDGKPIEEINNALDNVLDSILDQVKIAFDKDIEGFPAATATTIEIQQEIPKTITGERQTLFGFSDPGEPQQIPNQEYLNYVSVAYAGREDEAPNPLQKKVHKKITGQLVRDIFGSYRTNIQTYLLDNLNTDNQNATLFRVSAESTLNEAEQLSSFTSDINKNKPKWLLDYSELNDNKFKFIIKTGGNIQVSYPPTIDFSEKINFSGTLIQLDQIIRTKILNLGLADNASKLDVFKTILEPNIKIIIRPTGLRPSEEEGLIFNECQTYLNQTLKYKFFRTNNTFTDSKLLQKYNPSDFENTNSNSVLLDYIDFTPKQTEEQKACGIDTHILQLEAVKKRIKDEFNNSIPENLINTNSMVNTRYSDDKPGHLSKQIMFGLVDTFIRTSVIHNIFKGLFIFDKFKYQLSSFSYSYIIYLFIENRVQKDIKELELQKDFEEEYEKIVKKYVDEELIASNTQGTNFTKIIKYHVDSVLQFLNKLINGNIPTLQNTIPNDLQNTTPNSLSSVISLPVSSIEEESRKQKNKDLLESLTNGDIHDTYSLFYDFDVVSINRQLTPEERRAQNENSDDSTVTIATLEEVYIGKPKFSYPIYFTSNYQISNRSTSTLFPSFKLERYVKLEFEDYERADLDEYDPLYDLYHSLKNNSCLNSVINIQNFEEIYQNILNTLNSESRARMGFAKNKVVLYSEDPAEIPNRWLKSKPKFGLRLILQDYKRDTPPRARGHDRIIDDGFLHRYKFYKDDFKLEITNDSVLKNNKKRKIGPIQNFSINLYPYTQLITDEQQRDELQNSVVAVLEPQINTVIPIIEKELEFTDREQYEFPNLFTLYAGSDYVLPLKPLYEGRFLDNLKDLIISDDKLDLLVNYCLDINISNTLALFNSLVGMNSEPMYKLLDGTKKIIKNNFILHKNSGNFKNKTKNNAYNKQKDSKANGPPPLEMLKAAVTIPIGMLKGMATAVDPNIFFADKIVLAGKMGFIQPKYKRFTAGEKIPVIGSNELYEIDADGIAGDGTYQLIDGVFKIKSENERNGTGSPLIDYTPVVEIETVNEKLKLKKNSEGKVEPKYGPPYTGIPWDPKADSAMDPNFDEEDISNFDVRPSLPIFPGESINLPYKVASLALAPFPLFTPGLTAYNLAMPFGPLFLGLEDLLAQNPQLKFATAKKPETDTSANLSCKDVASSNVTAVIGLPANLTEQLGVQNASELTIINTPQVIERERPTLIPRPNQNTQSSEDTE